ncbi:MAG: hypothetical protein QF886_21455 [Planctomycetota bacterium]|jgi:hypothetical protein|nr:hypothetical protein [Planctomycetota bacterium]
MAPEDLGYFGAQPQTAPTRFIASGLEPVHFRFFTARPAARRGSDGNSSDWN